MSSDLLIITPPFTQFNCPYPAARYLLRYLKSIGYSAHQADMSIMLAHKVFSSGGMRKIFDSAEQFISTKFSEKIFIVKDSFTDSADFVMDFLQRSNTASARRIVRGGILPESGERAQIILSGVSSDNDIERARIMCTFFLADMARFISETVDSSFALAKYAERISVSAETFAPVEDEVLKDNIITEMYYSLLRAEIEKYNPDIFAVSIPFPGTLVNALRALRFVRDNYPEITRCAGGGFVNTELRNIREKKFFDYAQYMTLDDGEKPLLNIIKKARGESYSFKRTFFIEDEKIVFRDSDEADAKIYEGFYADYSDIDTTRYLMLSDNINPMLSMWNSDFYLKMTLAHGCYWKKCAFCDTSLDYICRFEPETSEGAAGKIEKLVKETGINSFHFTDEAAPPALLRELSLELIRRKLSISWWGNIRFEKSFSLDMARLLSVAGCIGVSGGLEAANGRILELMKKGVTLEEAITTCANFTNAGIMVHSYLIYGFPTQTEQEVSDSLETVRQMFENGYLTSAYFHRYAMTVHSDSGMNSKEYGVKALGKMNPFANNETAYSGDICDYSLYSNGLRAALNCYNMYSEIKTTVSSFFDFAVKKPGIKPGSIKRIYESEDHFPLEGKYILWNLSGVLEIEKKRGRNFLVLTDKSGSDSIEFSESNSELIMHIVHEADIFSGKKILLSEIKKDMRFAPFTESSEWSFLRENGIILVV
ncbi:MAG TPA: radical SAM protein [Spirochaetota bacterium]|nr:radical SAM protein [Spirochaetota bacterium]